MDYLMTGIVISLICLAAWLLYKRWVGRYRSSPEPEEEAYEDEEEEPTLPKPEVSAPEPIPEPGTKED